MPLLANDNNNNNELANNIDNRLQSSSSYLQPIELDEIFRDELSANLFNGSWISNNEIAFYDVEYNFCLYDVDQQITKRFIHFIQVVIEKKILFVIFFIFIFIFFFFQNPIS